MYCAGGGVLSKNLALCCAASIHTSRQLTIPILETTPRCRDFGVWPKKGVFLTFFQEDYYVENETFSVCVRSRICIQHDGHGC